MKKQKNLYRVFGVIIIVIIILMIVWIRHLFHEGKTYQQHRFKTHCHTDKTFCGLQVLPMDAPTRVRDDILQQIHRHKDNSVHVSFGKYRRGRTFPSDFVVRYVPSLVGFSKDLQGIISHVIGEDVELTDLSLPTTISILEYEANGEGIDWHYDSNHFQGRFFTLIIPIHNEGSGRFEYRDAHGHVRTLKARDVVLFEGNDVFHRGTSNYKGKRIVVSIQYVTAGGGKSAWWQKINRWLKDRAFVKFS